MTQKLAMLTNGVEIGRLTETISAVMAKPELGSFKFRIENRWIDGGENRSQVQPFSAGGKDFEHKVPFTLVADEHDTLLGTDNGANPVEYLMHALAACVTTSMVYHAAARGIDIQQIESTLEGDLDLRGFLGLDPNVRNGFDKIRMKLRVKGDFTDEQFRELSTLGPRFSPVYDSIVRGVPVQLSAERG